MASPDPINVRTTAPRGHVPPSPTRAVRVGTLAAVLITIGLLVVIGRVAQLKFDPPEQLTNRLDRQNSRATLLGRRGTIVDRHGRAMAVTRVAARLFVDPYLVAEPNTFSETVGYNLDYEPAWVEKKITRRPNSRYVVLDQQLTDERYARFQQLKEEGVDGLAIEPNLVREYPLGSLAGPVVGFVGRDGVGLEGLERTYDRKLLASKGSISFLRDATRKPLWVTSSGYTPPTDGNTIRLSLDAIIQNFAEEQLEQTCKEYDAQSGQIVIMQPHTGEILAMANYPSFDPNEFNKTKAEERRNRCVTDAFEPGSTFKPFVWAAAIETGAAHPDEVMDCTDTGVYVTSFGRRLHDAHPIGTVTFEQVLIKSSNIGMAYAGERLGAQNLWASVNAFGFGKSTRSGLIGEGTGIVRAARKWNMYSVTSVPMGQEVAVTSLQLARAFCVFANDGLMVQPTIIARDPADPLDNMPVVERLLSSATATHTRNVLRRVVTEGTARRANIKSYAIFGKTGTAQVPDTVNGGYMEDQYTSVFVGGAPLDDPQIVVTTMIHRPDKKKGYYGGIVAGPAAAKVIEKTLHYLGIQPLVAPEQSPEQTADTTMASTANPD